MRRWSTVYCIVKSNSTVVSGRQPKKKVTRTPDRPTAAYTPSIIASSSPLITTGTVFVLVSFFSLVSFDQSSVLDPVISGTITARRMYIHSSKK